MAGIDMQLASAGAERLERSPGTTSRLSVVHCLWNGEIGGAERAVFQLVSEQLQDPSLRPSVLLAQARGPYVDLLRSVGCEVIGLDIAHGRDVRKLGTAMKVLSRFELHHFHSAEPLLMVASARCKRARRVYTHRGGHIDYPLVKRVRHELTGVLLRRSFHAFSGNTRHGALCGAVMFRVSPERFRVTYNGLDFDLLRPVEHAVSLRAELGIRPNEIVVGTAANLKPWKRIDRLIDAVTNLSDADLRLLIVGDGPERKRLEAVAASRGIGPRVVFAGRRERPGDFFQLMDVFCLPSAGLESFGNAAVEAMACGLPAIVFRDGGGLTEHIRHEETGFIVDDQAALEDVLRRLIDDGELRDTVGRRAAASVRERYTTERAALAYKALYAEALASRPTILA
jgi:glycosyltransferase involved in cell wall biosynthesis